MSAKDKTAPESDIEGVASAATEEKVQELEILKQSLDQSRAQASEYYDQLLRLKAEFENFRKRAEKEKADNLRWGKEHIILQLVSLMDIMEQAEAVAKTSTDIKAIITGMNMLYAQFKRVLKDEGLEEVPARAGEKFNPEQHEAVEMVTDAGEEGRVLNVLQKGYLFQGGLLRPARVKVSQKAEDKAAPEKSASTGEPQ